MDILFSCPRMGNILLILFCLFLLAPSALAQGCSKENLCAAGCCSKFGHCGTGDEFCGKDCVGTCDYKLGCDANNPCKTGCCNKFGYCGLGPDYCGDDCVSGCDRKSYCDPGFGPEWAEVPNCPLNVCCSKYGFCGTTEEFCGDEKVTRPSCSKDSSLQRVVGYYETWSPRRYCDKFWPERIPLGVYTHINVAFAVVDPETFEIRPTLKSDISLYKRVTSLKKYDPDLKVFIAVGGWTYNDPGPTATTFSDLAASKENQKAFFRSLIKFMSTYGFDGIDFDWEYPVADDRSGRPEDFKNFPSLMKSLKAALKATGGRDGLSITIPASYWYLQHFDIKELAKHVDFFNIMTYDLHGNWDRGNKWLGAFLNAHTNLTEVTNSMDLLWRNDIPPEMVTLGMAFYGRAFTVADASCTEPGCIFLSGANAGKCSDEVGILMNSEISSISADRNLKPTLYEDAAVKVVTWDDQWVAYDDGETFKMKVDFARSQCMGGVMVWAVSHDRFDGTYSKALGKAVNRRVKALPALSEDDGTITNKHAQCKWTNCGEGCPSGWTPVPRGDPGARKNELMLDTGGCLIEGQFHVFCCPPDTKMPACGWYTHNNGRCDGTCPRNMVEVGSNGEYCNGHNFDKKNFQAACCTTETKNMALYDRCLWGDCPHCDYYKCPPRNSDIIAASPDGSGAANCYGIDWKTREERKYCCDTSHENMKWENCTWEDQYSTGDFTHIPKKVGSKFCLSNCPSDKVRVAMDHDSGCFSMTGHRARCCLPKYTTKVNVANKVLALEEAALALWLLNPTCGLESPKRMPLGNGMVMGNISDPIKIESTSAEKQGSSTLAVQLLASILFAFQSTNQGFMAREEIRVWDGIVGMAYPYVVIQKLIPFLNSTYHMLYTDDSDHLAYEIACDLNNWNTMVKLGDTDESSLSCEDIDLAEWDSEFNIDPDGYGTSGGYSLEKRDGSRREFKVDCGIDPVTGERRLMIITSHPYPNGANGDNLEAVNGLTVRFAVAHPDECYDSTVDPNAPGNVWQWVTEHILELQLIPRGIEFMVTGILPGAHGAGDYHARNPRLPWEYAQLLDSDYALWGRDVIPSAITGKPIDRIFNALGSKINPGHLVNAEEKLNSVKGRMFAGRQPIGNDTWKNYKVPQVDNARAAISELRLVISVFEYLNAYEIGSHLGSAYGDVSRELRIFDDAVNKVYPTASMNTYNLWREFMTNFMRRMTAWMQEWVGDRIRQLEDIWVRQYRTANDTNARDNAYAVLRGLANLRARMRRIFFDDTLFMLF